MSKLRILSNNYVNQAHQLSGSIYEYQRLFYNLSSGSFSINETLTGSVTGVTTGIIKNLNTLDNSLEIKNYSVYTSTFSNWAVSGSPTFDKTKPDIATTSNATFINAAAIDTLSQSLITYPKDNLCFSVYVAPNITNLIGTIKLEIIDDSSSTILETATFALTDTTTLITGSTNSGFLEKITVNTDYHYRRIYIFTHNALGKNITCKMYPTSIAGSNSIFYEAAIHDSLVPLTAIENTTAIVPQVETYTDYMDVLLTSDQVQYYPNDSIKIPETITTALGTAITKEGGSIIANHHDFPISNLAKSNRNKIIPAKNLIQTYLTDYHNLKISVTFSGLKSVSCISILNHNLTDTATIEIHLVDDNNNQVYTEVITNPNVNQFNSTSNYYVKNGSLTATPEDRSTLYKNNNIFIIYLPGSYLIEQLEIDIVDQNNTDDFTYIGGSLYVGDFYEVSTNFLDAWQLALNDTSTTTYAQSPMSVERAQFNTLSLNFDNIDRDELSFWRDLYKRKGTTKDFIIDLFEGSPDLSEAYMTFYGRFANPEFTMINNFLSTHSLQLLFRESI